MKNKGCAAFSCCVLVCSLSGVGRASTVETLKKNVDTLTMTISLKPFKSGQKDTGSGLRSVFLYTPNPSYRVTLEPHAQWRNGEPVSSDARITKLKMLGMIDTLNRIGFLKHAAVYYSEARLNPSSKPLMGMRYTNYLATEKSVVSCAMNATFTKGEYHYTVVSAVPFARATKTLNQLKPYIPKPLVSELLKTCQRFKH